MPAVTWECVGGEDTSSVIALMETLYHSVILELFRQQLHRNGEQFAANGFINATKVLV